MSFLFPIILAISGLACGASAPPTLDVYDIDRDLQGAGTVFIWAVGNGNEGLASSMLTARTRDAVSKNCPNGETLTCFSQAELQDWKNSQDITFFYRDSHGSTATYAVHWTDGQGATWIILEEVIEGGEWKIDSWRGLIPVAQYPPVSWADQLDRLVDGTDKTNQFPPDP